MHFQPAQISDLERFFEEGIDIRQVCQQSVGVDISFATEQFIAIEGEIIKEIFLFRFRLLDKGRETGLERVQLTRMHFEVGMETDKIRDQAHAPNVTPAHEHVDRAVIFI